MTRKAEQKHNTKQLIKQFSQTAQATSVAARRTERLKEMDTEYRRQTRELKKIVTIASANHLNIHHKSILNGRTGAIPLVKQFDDVTRRTDVREHAN